LPLRYRERDGSMVAEEQFMIANLHCRWSPGAV
jgi:hypothetical protein